MSTQYTLPLPFRTAMGAEDFIVTASNQEAVAMLDQWPDWPARIMVLQGEAGAGKTHLAQVWAQNSQALFAPPVTLATQLEQLLTKQYIIVDNADALFGDAAGEQALFHLCNHIQQQGHMLLTVRTAPTQATIALPDLRSRLRSYPLLSLLPPDDMLLAALLIKQFNDRQLRVGQDVVDYLLSRLERSAAAIATAVAALDRAALVKRCNITVPLARTVLEAQEDEG